MAQTLLTALIVGGSAAYVLWALLLPAAARRRFASALLRAHWPAFMTRHLQAQAEASKGCSSCEGCGDRPTQGAPQPVHWAPRRSR
jgi:hypothetical protein